MILSPPFIHPYNRVFLITLSRNSRRQSRKVDNVHLLITLKQQSIEIALDNEEKYS